MDLPPYLTKQVGAGKAALVLGAGASFGAIHPEGRTPPSGRDLGKRLSQEFLGGAHSDESLGVIAELAISESDLRTVQEFIRDLFEPFQPADFHKRLPTFRWHGIATLNYDLVIERAYTESPHQQLQPVVSNQDRIEDLRTSPRDLLYLKLHGCITRAADHVIPLILTPDQYVTHRKGRSRLFDILRDWARERTLVFVGTTLQDSDLRALLLSLTEDEPSRPRFYLVTPSLSDTLVRFWETKQITMLPFTFQDFLTRLDEELPGMARAVPVPQTALPVFERFSDPKPALTESARQILEHDLVYVHAGLDAPTIEPRQFYRGFSRGWEPIRQKLDCPRAVTDEILLDVILDENSKRAADLVVVRAEAGAGKSVLLHRLAWNAACDLDALCLFGRSDAVPNPEAFTEIADFVDERIFLFVDNAADCHAELEDLLDKARRRGIALSVIVAERANEWNFACGNLAPYVSHDYELRYLNDSEIGALLDLLTEHDGAGTLKGIPRDAQEAAFRKRAGRQLLVALHEATLGKPFEEIVRDEYESLVPDAARDMYLTICTLNRNGTPVRAGLVSRVHGITFERFQQDFFAPLEHVIFAELGQRRYDYEYRARHPHIAELVFRQAFADTRERYQRYAQILNGLNVSYATDRYSFRHIIKARSLMELFPEHALVEQLYALAEERVPDDGHVWLQHGNYEMNRASGNLATAGDLLRRAHDLLPKNPLITHAYAELELKRAMAATNVLVREKHIKTARELVRPLMHRTAKTAYGYHTAFKGEHLRLRDLLAQEQGDVTEDTIAAAIRNAESVIADGLRRFPDDDYLWSAEAELAKTLSDNARAVMALEKAASSNIRSVHVVTRLAKTYRDKGDEAKAKELLEKAVEAQPYERPLNYLLGRLLLDQDADGTVIEYHLRRAYTEGDRNHEARFWHARQLFINGKEEDARTHFGSLGKERIGPQLRHRVRGEWLEKGDQRWFAGRLSRIERGYAMIKRDGVGDSIFVPREHNSNRKLEELTRGERVRFTLAFNMRGPVALNVRSEG